MDGYSLNKKFFAYAYEDHKIKPPHIAVYYWITHRANESGWKKIIDIQTERSMDVLGITDWRTYKSALQYLHDCGLIVWVEKSKNQYTCNRVSLTDKTLTNAESYKLSSFIASAKNVEAIVKAIVEAHAKADVEAIAEALQSYINLKTTKPKTERQSEPLPKKIPFEEFWDKYDKKKGSKDVRLIWDKLSYEKQAMVMAHVPKYVAATPDKQLRKDPIRYLRGECWNDEIIPIASLSSKVPTMTASPGLDLNTAIKHQANKTYR